MNSSKIIASILILASLGMGYLGFNKISENTNQVNLLGIEIEASNKSGQQEGYLFVGIAVLLFLGGIYTLNKSQK
ncbi:hypothetical protein [Flavobacterium cellulosilyticum]|uniref:DUF3185 family protein n=1 Tax=Flavobacterium cellulosilyticum TaxID=2541731 RepID=A0A4R5C8Y9_9FLAO|nr:hypothetical protein [Flavobacterium cellulosilyticum]TDD95259.1 hypothetical protein E0F76_14545 [Flavobacterium cellulosilyticum]